jgi:hypothetical protein
MELPLESLEAEEGNDTPGLLTLERRVLEVACKIDRESL